MAEATQNQIRAAALIEQMWKDPEMGAKIRARAKELYPDVTTPEDTIAPVMGELKHENAGLRKSLDELIAWKSETVAKAEEARTFQTMESKVNAAVNKFSLTDEGRAKMLDRMKETGNYTDPDAAAALVAHNTPPAPSSGPSWSPRSLNLFGSKERDEKFAALHRDPVGFMDSELTEFVRNPDKYVSETFGNAA